MTRSLCRRDQAALGSRFRRQPRRKRPRKARVAEKSQRVKGKSLPPRHGAGAENAPALFFTSGRGERDAKRFSPLLQGMDRLKREPLRERGWPIDRQSGPTILPHFGADQVNWFR